jgi:hypothetical protein
MQLIEDIREQNLLVVDVFVIKNDYHQAILMKLEKKKKLIN